MLMVFLAVGSVVLSAYQLGYGHRESVGLYAAALLLLGALELALFLFFLYSGTGHLLFMLGSMGTVYVCTALLAGALGFWHRWLLRPRRFRRIG